MFISIKVEKEFVLYLQLLHLWLYADDTILQYQLEDLKDYRKRWHSKFNINKIKVVFKKKKTFNTDDRFTLGGEFLEIVDNSKYLGVLFCTKGSFSSNIKVISKSNKSYVWCQNIESTTFVLIAD